MAAHRSDKPKGRSGKARRTTKRQNSQEPTVGPPQTDGQLALSATALEGITDGLITVDHHWRCTYVNEAAATLLGTTPGATLGKIIWETFPRLRDSRFQEEFTRAAREKAFVRVEDYYEPLGRWCECRCYPTEEGLTILFSDATGSKRIEEAMLESRQVLEMALAGSRAGIWRIDLNPEKPGVMPDYVYLSPQLKALIGFENDEFPNSRSAWHARILPEDLARMQESGPDHAGGRTDVHRVDFRIRHKDGSIRWLSREGRLYRDEFDRPVRWAGLDWDITDRKRAEEDTLRFKVQAEQAAERVQWLARISEENPNPVLRISNEYVMLYSNPAAERLCEYWGCWIGQNVPPAVREIIADALAAGMVTSHEILCGDRTFWLAIAPCPAEDYVNVFARDITERKRMEESLRQANKQLQLQAEELQSANEELRVQQEELRAQAEELRDHEQTLREAHKQAVWLARFPGENPDPVLRVSADGSVIYNNPAAAESPGWGCTVGESLPQAALRRLVGQALADGQAVEQDVELDGTWYAVGVVPIRAECYANVYGHDITDRKRAEQELQRLARQRQLALDAAHMGWWHYDPITRVASWDDGYREIFGITGCERPADEILAEIIHAEDLPGLRAKMEAALNAVEPQAFVAQYRINRPDGQIRWIEAHGVASFEGLGADRRATSFVSTVADVTELKQAEQALAESEQRYRIMGESIDYGVWAADAEGKATYISPSFCKMVGRTFEHIREFGWLDRLVPAQRDEVVDLWMHSVRTGEPFEHEHHFIDRNGRIRIVLARGRSIRDEKGRIVSWAGINLDITERKRVEAALQESEQRLRLALEGGRMGLWEWDIGNSGDFWDERVYELLGLHPSVRASYEKFLQCVDPRDAGALKERIQNALAGGTDFQAEFRLVRFGGEIVWVASQGKVIWDPSGKAVRMLGIMFDVTQRKHMEADLRRLNDHLEEEVRAQTEELRDTVERLENEVVRRVLAEGKLRKSSQMLEGFFQHTITPLAFMDRRFNFVQVNEAYAKADDKTPEFFKGKNHFDLYPHDENRAIFERVVRTGESYRAFAKPFSYPDRPQEVTYWDWQLTPLRNERGEVQYLVLNLQDVTQQQAALRELEHRAHQLQKLTLELSQAEDRERRRMAEVLHDGLQQQLAAAKFHLGLLNSRARSDAGMQEIAVQLDSMLCEAIEQSRSLSHELSPAVLYQSDLGETFEWLARQVQTKHGLTVHTEIYGRVDSPSESIKAFLFRTGQEILFNAVKHARVQEARLRLQRRGGRLWLTIADQGRGFDPKTLGRTAGFGLLSIRERVGLLGGRMRIRSAPGKGSTFLIAVPDDQMMEEIQPAADRRREAVGAPPACSRQPAASGGRLRVLLVDDHKVMREGLAALISEQKDMEIVGQAGDGGEAVELAREKEPDVIIMDVSMPVTPGDEATRQIKAELPQTRIIALSMFAEPGVRERMLDAGAEAYLAKTGPSEVFLAAIRGPAARD